MSPTLISTVTDEVEEEVKAWQSRPLEGVYPIVYLDAIRIKIRSNNQIVNKAVYLALRNIAKKWTVPIKNWKSALNQFAILFEGRMPLA
ncbi:MAG: transposase [Alphaproteobacteria bacterium]|uniref:Mutator family transposase n=1 Tax=Candidatus Nitrobium versatile TaxID=2884831 RepID=A0A953JBG0_9BACT|nr:transposase [Candidatus Nitrobium versatile]